MKRALEFVWGLLRSNLLLKIMAIVFAVILWSYVLAETNPIREKELPDIKLRYAGSEVLKSKNLTVSGSLSDVLDTVDVRVEVSQNDLKRLSRDNVDAYVDLSAINGPGTYKLDIKATPNVGNTVEISPATVELNVYSYETRQVPVNINVTGSVTDGYYAMTPEISPSVITISGASVDVDKVTSAMCDIDLTGLTEGYNKSMEVRLLDADGNELDKSLFTDGLSSVIVKLQVLATKMVPVDVNSAIMGQNELAAGYEIASISCAPDTVMIAGDPDTIRGITTMSLMPYSVSGASTSVAVMLDFQLPEGVSVLTDAKAQVYVEIRQTMDTKIYSGIAIEDRNLGAGLTAQMDVSRTDVTVMAGVSQLSRLKRSDIVPYVDLEGLGKGKHTVPVVFQLPDGFTEENFSSGVKTVVVTIY
jgi:YbbR domain-containing protein